MKEEYHETMRQKWFPTPSEADRYATAKGHGYGSDYGILVLARRWARSAVVGGFLALTAYCGAGNNVEYSAGERVGVINKFSHKGVLFKTYEGEMALEGIVSDGSKTGANVWDFSLDRKAWLGEDTQALRDSIQSYMRNGIKVRITYQEPLATWPWRSGTDHLVQKVEPMPK